MTYNKERHFFLGGNTYKGFHSFFNYLINKEEANRVICIKGGPGTGKSYLMKKVAAFFLDKGYSVEYNHCSSDEKSLDGIVIPELKIAMLDGTAPHMVDPIYPGAIDEIINMGIALDNDALSLNKKELISVYKEISNNFQRAYKFLSSAKPIHDDWSRLNSKALDYSKIITITDSLKEEVFNKQKSGFGDERHIFATAFTPSGILTFTQDLVANYKHKFVLQGGPGFSKTKILLELGKLAQKKGYFVEYLHDPFNPERIEHILIPEISVSIVTENEISKCSFEGKIYNIEDFCDNSILKKNEKEIEYDKYIFNELTDKALKLISNAHTIHDDLESYYIKSLNFDLLNSIFNDTINKLTKYI
ncbi:MAG: ATPase [Clostridium sp.]|uniref:ATPase n=1 Tax=Clostridium sp. TaxID=1506 RepID=UPI0025C0E348|nr:ATPase [Clostridium sp.]MCF0146823.1 ATPase [Clostridium sp.]